jgi:hypothetical protein
MNSFPVGAGPRPAGCARFSPTTAPTSPARQRRLGSPTHQRGYVRRYHYDGHEQQRAAHLAEFIAAYNDGRRLKTLRGLTPFEAICEAWTADPGRFRPNPLHQMPGPNISSRRVVERRLSELVAMSACGEHPTHGSSRGTQITETAVAGRVLLGTTGSGRPSRISFGIPARVVFEGKEAGDPGRARTYDLPLRRRLLYPAELRGLPGIGS